MSKLNIKYPVFYNKPALEIADSNLTPLFYVHQSELDCDVDEFGEYLAQVLNDHEKLEAELAALNSLLKSATQIRLATGEVLTLDAGGWSIGGEYFATAVEAFESIGAEAK